MCLWLVTACFGLLPSNPAPAQIIVIPGVPAPILQPTTTASVSNTPPGNLSPPPMPGNQTAPPPPPPTTSNTPPASQQMTNPPPPPMSSALVNPPSTGGVLLPIVICQNPSVVCVANPNQPSTVVTVSPPIDPRLGTTPALSAPLQLPSIVAYNGYIPSYDTAVKFPRERRSLRNQTSGEKISQSNHVIEKRQSCVCVPVGTCPAGGKGTLGNGLIDIRIVTPNNPAICGAGTEYCCPDGGSGGQTIACGTRQASPATVITPSVGQASFGEYPWMVLLLTKQNDYIGGGVLIDQLNILTVIHRLQPYLVGNTAPNVKARLGEWDAAGTYEPIPHQEYSILKVFTHPSYNSATLQYDLAVVRLATAVPITPQAGAAATINRACLPSSPGAVFTGQRCWVTGWGKDAFGVQGNYQQILKEVEVPIVAPASCQTTLRNARLGNTYVLDTTSFICAGGEAQRDSCTGDGGSGLVCNVNGRWTVAGLVSWGLGCATAGVPAVYVNVATLLPWIQQQLSTP